MKRATVGLLYLAILFNVRCKYCDVEYAYKPPVANGDVLKTASLSDVDIDTEIPNCFTSLKSMYCRP